MLFVPSLGTCPSPESSAFVYRSGREELFWWTNPTDGLLSMCAGSCEARSKLRRWPPTQPTGCSQLHKARTDRGPVLHGRPPSLAAWGIPRQGPTSHECSLHIVAYFTMHSLGCVKDWAYCKRNVLLPPQFLQAGACFTVKGRGGCADRARGHLGSCGDGAPRRMCRPGLQAGEHQAPLLAPYGLRAVVTQVGDGRQGRSRSGVAACSRRRSGCRAGGSLEGSMQPQLGLQGPSRTLIKVEQTVPND